MTAPTPEKKIQRWTEQLEGSNMAAHEAGEWVDYWDHLRHLKLAQIEALEEVWKEMPSEDFEEDEPLYRKDMVFLKIAALRKELGG